MAFLKNFPLLFLKSLIFVRKDIISCVMSYVIADSGSTKTHWCVVENDGQRKMFRTGGINPVYLAEEEIGELLERELPERPRRTDRVWFYGAGCAFPEKNEYVCRALCRAFGATAAEVASDLLGAARALCGQRPGIVCILGTGSNSCYYDGEVVCSNVPPLGYILGDEGSGAVLGKKLLAGVLKGVLPAEIREMFFRENGLSYAELIACVYNRPWPNRFLAGLVPFIARHREEPALGTLVTESFGEFLRRNVLQYAEARSLPVSFTGSVAWHFKDFLLPLLQEYGLQAGVITQAPMEGLIQYHAAIAGR